MICNKLCIISRKIGYLQSDVLNCTRVFRDIQGSTYLNLHKPNRTPNKTIKNQQKISKTTSQLPKNLILHPIIFHQP